MQNRIMELNEEELEIYGCIKNLHNLKSFFLFAGAGSGKTHSLVKILQKYKKDYSQNLRFSNKQIAIITYTNAACDEIKDRLENYVLEWGIKGNTWLKEWTFGKSDLEKINQIRRQVIEPIVEFKNKFSKQKKVSEIAKELYNFLIEIKAYENIQNKIKELKEKENPSETEIEITNTYIQVWNIFIKLLDEIVMVLGEEVVSFDRFKNILKQGIMQNQI